MNQSKLNLKYRLIQRQGIRVFKLLILAVLGFILASLLFNLLIRLPINSSKPVDAILVLGGSIQREIYAAQLASQSPNIPIVISQGSKDPCIWLIFQREQAPLEKVWLEKCANSTFDNFFFSVPILRKLGVNKVKLITSPSHLPRAKWLSQIHLGVQGIAVEVDTVLEKGIPGNQESLIKTQLDVTRSLFWSIASLVFQPSCSKVTPLAQVNLKKWHERGFKCEHQGGLSKRKKRW